ncbi:MAG: hypothetical protein ACKPKO_38695, partial [Candidatus Fonsibacter sp.]
MKDTPSERIQCPSGETPSTIVSPPYHNKPNLQNKRLRDPTPEQGRPTSSDNKADAKGTHAADWAYMAWQRTAPRGGRFEADTPCLFYVARDVLAESDAKQ